MWIVHQSSNSVVALLQVRIFAGVALKERQCTLEWEAQYVNVRGSVHWEGGYKVGEWTLRV